MCLLEVAVKEHLFPQAPDHHCLNIICLIVSLAAARPDAAVTIALQGVLHRLDVF